MNKETEIKEKVFNLPLKSFPSEILTLICSFGYPEYKEHMKEITNEIINQSGLLEYNMNLLYQDYYHLHNVYNACLHSYLMYALTDKVLEDLFIQCTKCYCCSKHCHNRPTNYYTNEVSIGENYVTNPVCECKCRQLARFIKRVEYSENHKKKKKYRKKSTFNIQFIPLSIRTRPRRALFDQANPQVQP
jgi:hypothetical protein